MKHNVQNLKIYQCTNCHLIMHGAEGGLTKSTKCPVCGGSEFEVDGKHYREGVLFKPMDKQNTQKSKKEGNSDE